MLQFSDQPYEYFPPKPNRLIAWLGEWWSRRYLLAGPEHRIQSVTVENAGPLQKIQHEHGARVLLLPNHSTHSDPMIMAEACRQVGVWSIFMAAYDVFLRSRAQGWVMQRMGAFSVNRDGSDRRSMKDAIATVIDGRYALTVFPEGNVYFMNDRVTPFLEGPAYIAMKAQQEMKDAGRIFAVPVSIKATHTTDARVVLQETLDHMAEQLGVEASGEDGIVQQVHAVGVAMIRRNLSQRGFLPPNPDYTDLPKLLQQCARQILNQLEAKMGLASKEDDDLMDRIRTARREIHKVRSDPDREIDHAVAAGWADEAIIAFRILSYAGNYLSENPTLDRVGETIEKLQEDLYSRAFPAYANRAVTVRFGDPICVSEQLAAAAKPRLAMAALTDQFEAGVQAGLDQINAHNSHSGGEPF